jgi:hypothetical protein
LPKIQNLLSALASLIPDAHSSPSTDFCVIT